MEVIKIKNKHTKNRQNSNNNIDKETNIYYYIINRKDIAKFTYQDYLKCIEQKEDTLKENNEKYEIVNSRINNKHDKTYRKILSSKKDAVYIINKALKLKNKIKESEIQKYNSSYITNQLLNKEADIIYKLKNKEIYFLIEHQSKVDYSMPYRIQEYKIEIIKSAIDTKKIKTKQYEMPVVIPIVIYTGKRKWNVRKELNKIQEERLEEVNLLKYNLIDINEYTKEELIESKSFIDKIFLLEKTETKEEWIQILEYIIKHIRPQEDKENLINIARATLEDKIGEENLEKLIKEMKGEDEEMFAFVEMIEKENRKIRLEGIKEGKIEMIKAMKKNNIAIELIEKVTGLTKEKIEKM